MGRSDPYPVANGAEANWDTAQVVGDGHLTPISLEFSAFDSTIGATIFDSGLIVKVRGNGNHNQPTTACSPVQTATLVDFLEPGDPVPPGAALTDTVTFTVAATEIAK